MFKEGLGEALLTDLSHLALIQLMSYANLEKVVKGVLCLASLERGLDVLEYIAMRRSSCSLDQISAALDIPRTSCYRLLKTLHSKGYIQLAETIGREQKWELTYKLCIFADLIEEEMSLRKLARPYMKELADAVDLFVQLGIMSNNKVLYIDDVKRSKVLRVYAPKWSYLDVHACAAGLAIAAHLPRQHVEEIVKEHGLTKKTSKTIDDEATFYAVLEQVRQQRYAIDDEYYANGIKCVAAPIFNYSGKCVAAVGVTGHSDEFVEMGHIIEKVQECATKISRQMHFDGGSVAT